MKKEILLIPFFGWTISRLKPISINRKLKVESLKKVIEVGGGRIIGEACHFIDLVMHLIDKNLIAKSIFFFK